MIYGTISVMRTIYTYGKQAETVCLGISVGA